MHTIAHADDIHLYTDHCVDNSNDVSLSTPAYCPLPWAAKTKIQLLHPAKLYDIYIAIGLELALSTRVSIVSGRVWGQFLAA